MAIIGEWIRRLGYLLRRRRHEDELRREMEAHRALLGDPRAFGNTLRLRDEARDAWGWAWLDDLVHDTRFALRTLRRGPGFALAAVVTLALGIGVNSGMFSVINGLLLRPLYERPDEVVRVYSRSTGASGRNRGVSYPNYRDLREGTTAIFESLAAIDPFLSVGLDDGERTRRTMAAAVSANYFQTFGVRLALGRPFTPEEEWLGAGARVAIVSYRFWEQRGADADVLGRLVRVNGEPFTVVGVAPEGFTGASIPGPELWLPFGAYDALIPDAVSGGRPIGTRDAHELNVMGRLRAGSSVETAAPALATVSRRLEQAFPADNAGYTLEISASAPTRLMFFPGSGSGRLALLLMLMPAIVLLVACLNLVDLLLARGHVRRQEMAIRSSLGGGRARLMRQLVTEGLLLAFAGGAVGLLLSRWTTDALLASVYPVLPVDLGLPEMGLDWRVLVATVGFSLVATVVFSAAPAWASTGGAALSDLERNVVDDGTRRPGGLRIGNALVIGQVALSILLLASGGLFVMSARSAATADPGFRLDGGLLVEVDPGLAGYDEARGRELHRALVDRLRTIPGVEAVTIGSRLPFASIGDSRIVAPAGASDGGSRVGAAFSVVDRDYARALGLPMLGGRDFIEAELAPGSSEPVAIIDDALAQRLWPGEPALGRLIQFPGPDRPGTGRAMRVVGIMPAVKHSLGNARPFPHVYVPLGQHYESAMTLQLRIADADAERAMLATVGRVVRDVDERVPVVRLETWRDHLDASLEMWLYRAGASVFSAFGGIALLLAVIGVYGVKSYVVSRRTREFGIRIAIGAHPRALLWQVLREGGRITAVGIGIGVLLALGAGRLLQGLLYGVNAVEPVVLVTAPLVLLGSSLLASYVPTRRATKIDPTVALRSE
jgi:predicted permease